MGISSEQALARQRAIGSSDIPAILGLNPRRGALEVYASKVFDLEPDETGEAARLGNRFESAILEEAADRLGVRISQNVHAQGPEPYLAANLDAVVVPDRRQAMEAKFSSLAHLFQEPGTDQIPEWVLVQTAYQMGCLPSVELVYVPVLVPRYGRVREEIYEAPRNADLVEIVLEVARKFWREHVEPRVPPPPTVGLGESALGVLKRARRQPASVAVVAPELAAEYRQACATAKLAGDVKARAQAALLAAGGEAEALDFGDGKKIYTYYEYGRASIDLKKLLEDHPELEQQYSYRSAYRSLKLVNR